MVVRVHDVPLRQRHGGAAGLLGAGLRHAGLLGACLRSAGRVRRCGGVREGGAGGGGAGAGAEAPGAAVTPFAGSSPSRRSENTQTRKSRKRSTVAARLAAISTASSVECAGLDVAVFRAKSEPLVSARPMPKTTRPWAWCLTAPPGPRTPKVSRRLAAVLATADTSSASALATWDPPNWRNTV